MTGYALLPLGAEAPITVVVAAEIRLYRDGLADALRRAERIDVAAVACDADGAVAAAERTQADVLLLDISMEHAFRALRALARRVPATRVVVLGISNDEILECAEAGMAGFVTSDQSIEELISTVNQVAAGELPCSPQTAALLLRRVQALATARRSLPVALTSREHEIVTLIEEGLSNKQIAARLSIQLATVKNHVHNILEKLHVERRSEAAAWARRDGHHST
jgi:DNA-binding NarL/FixJ family response regulator